MINIKIQVKEGKVYDECNYKDSTLQENSLALRRLEEIKRGLLEIDYEDELYVEEE